MEEWIELEGGYELSSEGRLRKEKKSGLYYYKQSKDKVGYYHYFLTFEKYQGKSFYVHRLVAEQFVPGYQQDLEVNHIDGDKSNNAASNLSWVTAQENYVHAVDIGLLKRGPRGKQKNPYKGKRWWQYKANWVRTPEHRKLKSDIMKEYWIKRKAEEGK